MRDLYACASLHNAARPSIQAILTCMSKWNLFLISVLLTMGVALGYFYWNRPLAKRSRAFTCGRALQKWRGLPKTYPTSQLRPPSVPIFRSAGSNHRRHPPRWRGPDQTPSAEIKSVSMSNGLGFHYIPVPHESIPNDAVKALDQALTPRRCPRAFIAAPAAGRSGSFALVQASRFDGPPRCDPGRWLVPPAFPPKTCRTKSTNAFPIEPAPPPQTPVPQPQPIDARDLFQLRYPSSTLRRQTRLPFQARGARLLEYFLRFLVVALGFWVGLTVADIIGWFAGWIPC